MLCVYDLETTGLLNGGRRDLPGIIQIAAVKYDVDGNEVAQFETRVNPEVKREDWEPGAIKTTGIGPDQIQDDWPTFFETFYAFAEFVCGSTVLCGYNSVRYDDPVLHNNLLRYGFEKNFPWPPYRIDVMSLAKEFEGKFKPPKLVAIYKKLFGEELEGAHDALADVRGTARVGFEIDPTLAKRYHR